MALVPACALALLLLPPLCLGAQSPTAWTGSIDLGDTDREFMGVGGLSGGGGTSRLLYDYPTPQRDDILDALFAPKKGGNVQILKVEIGGDGQSTEATEASHMHSRDDENYERGYEWWLMSEAKKRNPDIKLYGLSWAVPGWVGNGSYYAGDDNIDYHLKWLEGAKSHHGLDIDYLGIWNERSPDYDWVVRLRSALDKSPHNSTVIVGADTGWICDDLAKNKTVADAIGVLGAHYPITDAKPKPLPASCGSLDKPFWTSEGWSLGEVNDYGGALNLGRTINYNYIDQNQTAMIVWTVIYAWYSILPFAHPTAGVVGGIGHGLMTATQPWSGHYQVQAPLYMVAHTTQFVEPGCRYISTASVLGGSKLIGADKSTALATAVAFVCDGSSGGGSGDSSGSEDGSSASWFTLVVETVNAAGPIHGAWKLVNLPSSSSSSSSSSSFPSSSALHVWETCNSSYFKQLPDVAVGPGGEVEMDFQPQCVYTLSTSVGQGAVSTPAGGIPAPARFPMPYADDFDHYRDQATVKYFTDQGGSFNANGKGQLEQVVDTRPIEWGHNPDPITIAGDSQVWSNYTVSVKAKVLSPSPLPPLPPLPPLHHAPSSPPPPPQQPSTTAVKVCGRIATYSRGGRPPNGVCLIVDDSSHFFLVAGGKAGAQREVEGVLASGSLSGAGADPTKSFVALALQFEGNTAIAFVNGARVASVDCTHYPTGMVGLGSGWNKAAFDDLTIA